MHSFSGWSASGLFPTVNTLRFINGRWWNFWKPVLPAMIKAFLPDGVDGRGRWLQQDLDAAFNKSCGVSMHEYLAKDRDATVQDYAKTIKRVTNVLKVSWEGNWAVDYQLGSQIVKGLDMKARAHVAVDSPKCSSGVVREVCNQNETCSTSCSCG